MTVPKKTNPETEEEETDDLEEVQAEAEPESGPFRDSVKGPGQGPTGRL